MVEEPVVGVELGEAVVDVDLMSSRPEDDLHGRVRGAREHGDARGDRADDLQELEGVRADECHAADGGD